MKAIFWLIVGLAALVAFVSYVVWGETGPIGWINAGQVSVFGWYSRRISGTVLLALVGLPVMAIWAVLAPNSLRRNAQTVGAVMDTPVQPQAMRTSRLAGWVSLAWAVCVALVWVGVYGSALWERHRQNTDASAAYSPLELTPGMKDAAAGHEYLALRGPVLGQHAVSRKKDNNGDEAMTLLPVVERGWHEGDPVHFVLRFGAEEEAPLRKALQQSESLRVRTDGAVPTLARRAFERLGAPLADDAVTVVPITALADDSAGSVPDGGGSHVVTSGAIGTALVTGLFAMIVGALVGSARQARKQTAKKPG